MLEETWRDLLIDDSNTAFDELAHQLLNAMNTDTISFDGMKRVLTALWPMATEEERSAATDIAVKAHAKYGRHCLCCKAALGDYGDRYGKGAA